MIHIHGIWTGKSRRTTNKAMRRLQEARTQQLASELLPTKREARLLQSQQYRQQGGN